MRLQWAPLPAAAALSPAYLTKLTASQHESACGPASEWLALEQLLDQLPASNTTALRLTVLQGLSVHAAAERMEISAELSTEILALRGGLDYTGIFNVI